MEAKRSFKSPMRYSRATAADNEGQPETQKPGSKRLKTRGWWDERAEDGEWTDGKLSGVSVGQTCGRSRVE